MPTKLGSFDLVLKTVDSRGVITEMRAIKDIQMENNRRIEQRTSSSTGSDSKDTGRHAAKIIIEGEIAGKNASQGVTDLRNKFKAGEPLEFVSNISLIAGTNKVVIEELQIENFKGIVAYFKYKMNLKEYIDR